MGIRRIEYECLCGNKIVLNMVEGGAYSPSPCESCGRYGSFRLKGEELYFEGPDFLMEELENAGLEKIEMKDIGSWIRLKKWRFID